MQPEVRNVQTLFGQGISKKGSYELKKYEKGYMIPLISDTMFSVMMNNESKKKYVCYFLSLVLEKEFKEIEETIVFMKQDIDREKVYQSRQTVDFVCRFGEEIWNIEMNNTRSVSSLERNISYLMELYKSNMKVGEEYKYQKVIQININNFSFVGEKKTKERWYIKDEEGRVVTEKIEFINLYLPNIRKERYNESKLSEVDKLLLAFNEEEDLCRIWEGNEVMKEYREEAREASCDEEVIGLYDKEYYDEFKRVNEIRDARNEGIEQAKKEMVIVMLEKNMDIEEIGDITKLTKDEILQMKQDK